MTPESIRLDQRIIDLCAIYLRPVTYSTYDEASVEFTQVFEPPLSVEEQAIFDDIVRLARGGVSLSPADLQAIRPQLQILRDLRQLGRNAFMALTAADRDRAIYDALVAQTIIDLALVRD